jgi:hypothetical protein
VLDHACDPRRERRLQVGRRVFAGECIGPALPQRQVHVSARALLAGVRLREEARPQTHRRRDLFHTELEQRGIVGRREPSPRLDVELEQARSGLRVHGGYLDAETPESGDQLVEESRVPADLVQAVADPARSRRALLVPDPDLVLDRSHDLVPQPVDVVEHAPEDLARGERGGPVGPARRRQTHAPAGAPPEVVERLGVGAHDQVGRAHADPEALVVRDRRVGRIEPDDEVGHHRAVLEGGLERVRAQGLAAQRPVHVGDREEDELLARCSGAHAGEPARSAPTRRSASAIAAAKRSTISVSSASVLV